MRTQVHVASAISASWIELLGAVFGAGGLTQLGNWLAARGRSKSYVMGAVDHAVETAMSIVTTRLETVERQHGDCEAKLREVRVDLDEVKRDREQLKQEIDRLMSGPVANYAPRNP